MTISAKTNLRKIGQKGEGMAVEFLQSHDYEILHRNYRWARGEIDIVARKDSLLVFVEVKTARQNRFGPPETWVNARKQRQIADVAQHFLQQEAIQDMDCRFDVVAVSWTGVSWKIKHIEDAFRL